MPDLYTKHKLSWQLNFKHVATQGHGTAVRLLIMLTCMATCKFSGCLQFMFRWAKQIFQKESLHNCIFQITSHLLSWWWLWRCLATMSAFWLSINRLHSSSCNSSCTSVCFFIYRQQWVRSKTQQSDTLTVLWEQQFLDHKPLMIQRMTQKCDWPRFDALQACSQASQSTLFGWPLPNLSLLHKIDSASYTNQMPGMRTLQTTTQTPQSHRSLSLLAMPCPLDSCNTYQLATSEASHHDTVYQTALACNQFCLV